MTRPRPTTRAQWRPARGGALLAAACALWVAAPTAARAEETLPPELTGVQIEERLGDSVDLGLPLVDEGGGTVRLGDLLRDGLPTILTLNYYECTALCNLQLNGLVEALRGFEWAPGQGYRIVTVSINPREPASLAKAKRAAYLEELGLGPVDWRFLVASQASITALTRSVGFGYRYDPETDQYAHTATLIFLSPQGKITRYLYGISYEARDLKFAIMEAAEGKVGSTVDKILLTCFHYDSERGQYAPFAFGIMRLGAVASALVLGLLLLTLWLKERRKHALEGSP